MVLFPRLFPRFVLFPRFGFKYSVVTASTSGLMRSGNKQQPAPARKLSIRTLCAPYGA